MTQKYSCPYTYADGRKCQGHVVESKAYGPRQGNDLLEVRKVRLWCSERDDHQGADGVLSRSIACRSAITPL
jgi:hypothetical protein